MLAYVWLKNVPLNYICTDVWIICKALTILVFIYLYMCNIFIHALLQRFIENSRFFFPFANPPKIFQERHGKTSLRKERKKQHNWPHIFPGLHCIIACPGDDMVLRKHQRSLVPKAREIKLAYQHWLYGIHTDAGMHAGQARGMSAPEKTACQIRCEGGRGSPSGPNLSNESKTTAARRVLYIMTLFCLQIKIRFNRWV